MEETRLDSKRAILGCLGFLASVFVVSVTFGEGHIVSWILLPIIWGLDFFVYRDAARASILMYLFAFSHDALIYLIPVSIKQGSPVLWSLEFYPAFIISFILYSLIRKNFRWLIGFLPYVVYLLGWLWLAGFQTTSGYNMLSFSRVADWLEMGSWLTLFFSMVYVDMVKP